MNERSKDPKHQHPAGQTLAEWVTLGISCLILLSIAGFLVIQARRSHEKIAPIEVRFDLGDARQVDARHYLPITITNRGTRSMRDLKVRVRYRLPDGQPDEGQIEIDYLGEASSQAVYWIFPADPRGMDVRAEPLQYRLD